MRPELVGNPVRQILHGGVISATLDVVGGLAIALTGAGLAPSMLRRSNDWRSARAVSVPWRGRETRNVRYLLPATALENESARLLGRPRLRRFKLEMQSDQSGCEIEGTYVAPQARLYVVGSSDQPGGYARYGRTRADREYHRTHLDPREIADRGATRRPRHRLGQHARSSGTSRFVSKRCRWRPPLGRPRRRHHLCTISATSASARSWIEAFHA